MAPKSKNDNGVFGMVKNVYNDPFMWSLVKSWAFFAGGIFVAREWLDFDANAPATP
ncbi:hypothetical protein BLOT_002392 [Blomia tropicalis]|nr:hypothetical protein BLOT_002392 [Blomia tropicalis]